MSPEQGSINNPIALRIFSAFVQHARQTGGLDVGGLDDLIQAVAADGSILIIEQHRVVAAHVRSDYRAELLLAHPTQGWAGTPPEWCADP